MRRIVISLSIVGLLFSLVAFQCSSTELTSAKLYIQQENYDKAKEALLKEIEKNPKSDEGNYLLGTVYSLEGDYDNMLKYFDASLAVSDKFSSDINRFKLKGWADGFNDGVRFFNSASKVTAQDSIDMFYDRAVNAFENAIKCQPDSTDSYKNLAFAYMNAGRHDDAIPTLKKLIDMGGSSDNYRLLGEIYTTKSEKLMASYKSVGNKADSIAAIASYNEAIALLEKGRTDFPEDGELLLLLSNAYIKANKMDVAMDAFKAGVKQDPNNQYYRYNYGVLLLQGNNFEEAEEQFKTAIDIDPEYTNAIYNLAVTNVKWGTIIRDEAEKAGVQDDTYKTKFQAALPALEQYLSLNPEDAAIWELLGKVYANLGNTEKSTEAFNRADELR